MLLPRVNLSHARAAPGEGRGRRGPDGADVSERIRVEQLDMLARLTQVMSLVGLNTLGFLYWVFRHVEPAVSRAVPVGLLLVGYAVVLRVGRTWRRMQGQGARADASFRFVRRYAALVLLVAVSWAALLVGLNAAADGDQRAVLYATTIGVVSSAAVFVPVSVALAFWAPTTLGGLLILALNHRAVDAQLLGLFLGYSPLVLFTALFINRTMARRVAHEAKIQEQADVIGLLLRDFEQDSSHWLWEIDGDLKLRNVSPRFAHIAQRSGQELVDVPLPDLLGEPGEGDAASSLVSRLRARSAFANLVVPVDVAGQVRWWSLTGRPLFDRHQGFAGYRGVGADVTEATRDAQRTAYLASHDGLTDLANRAEFHRALAEACQAAERPFAVLYLDLDGFKRVNDTLGHAAGDALLFAVAQRLKGCVRDGDVVARLGGDEFAVLMADGSEQSATLLAQRVLASMATPVQVERHAVEVGVSIGIALSNADPVPAALLRDADAALYRAKADGRSTYRVFSRTTGEAGRVSP